MTRRARVDAELVRRGLARSRQQAAELAGTSQRDCKTVSKRQNIEQQKKQGAHQSEFFCQHGKDEVSLLFRQKILLFCGGYSL